MRSTLVPIFLILILTFSRSSFAQRSAKLESDIIGARCVLSIQCTEKLYDNALGYSLSKLESVGIQVKQSLHLNENPTLKKKDMEMAEESISGMELDYWISLYSYFKSLDNQYKWELVISKIEQPLNQYRYPEGSYILKSYSLEKLFYKLDKKIAKLN